MMTTLSDNLVKQHQVNRNIAVSYTKIASERVAHGGQIQHRSAGVTEDGQHQSRTRKEESDQAGEDRGWVLDRDGKVIFSPFPSPCPPPSATSPAEDAARAQEKKKREPKYITYSYIL